MHTAVLGPYLAPHGPLQYKRKAYVPGRSNVIITYPGTTQRTVSFVGRSVLAHSSISLLIALQSHGRRARQSQRMDARSVHFDA